MPRQGSYSFWRVRTDLSARDLCPRRAASALWPGQLKRIRGAECWCTRREPNQWAARHVFVLVVALCRKALRRHAPLTWPAGTAVCHSAEELAHEGGAAGHEAEGMGAGDYDTEGAKRHSHAGGDFHRIARRAVLAPPF